MIKIFICIVSILIGLIFGYMICSIALAKCGIKGTMYVNEDDPDYLTCGVSMDCPAEELLDRKYILLKIESRENQRL